MNASLPADLGRIPLKRKIAAILAADVAGYSRLVAENEERTLTELAAAREIFDGLVRRGGGRIFNTAGDSVMCEFDSAVEAVRVAVDIQDSLRARNASIPTRQRLEFRMGLTIGDVVERDGDLLGDGVNIAARLEGLAPPGGICVSRSVHEAVVNKLSVEFRSLGQRQVKNIPLPIQAYLVAAPSRAAAAAVDEDTAEDGFDRRRIAVASARRERSGGGLRLGLLGLALGAGGLGALAAYGPLRGTVQGFFPASRTAPNGEAATAPPPGRNADAGSTSAPPVVSPPAGSPTPGAATAPPRNEASGTTPATRPTQRPPRGTARTDAAPRSEPATPPVSRSNDTAARTEPPRTEPKPETRPADPKSETASPPATTAAEAPRVAPPDSPAAFSALGRSGLLPDPKSLAELYHNARFLEGKGDRAGALGFYASAAPLAGDFVDVHMRYASLLRALKGASAVRTVYGSLARSSPSEAAALVLAVSAEGSGGLDTFVDAHPDDAVAAYLQAEGIDTRDPATGLTDRRLAFDGLERFLDAAVSGTLAGRFVDRSFLDGWIETARRHRSEIEQSFNAVATRPTASFSRSASGWLAHIALPEPATELSVKVGERGEAVPTGFGRALDPRTGKPAPNTEVELPASLGRSTLYVSYRDRSGREAGPFPIAFDPGSAAMASGRTALEQFPDSWVTFRPDIPDLLSFAGLVSNRCAISKAAIGFGDDAPSRALPLPACDAAGAATMPSGSSLIRLPDGVDSVQVQLTYQDGSESQVRTFRRP